MRYVIKIEKEFINKEWLLRKINEIIHTLNRKFISYNFVETDTAYKFYIRNLDKAYINGGDYDPAIVVYEYGKPNYLAIIGYGDTMPQVSIRELSEY